MTASAFRVMCMHGQRRHVEAMEALDSTLLPRGMITSSICYDLLAIRVSEVGDVYSIGIL